MAHPRTLFSSFEDGSDFFNPLEQSLSPVPRVVASEKKKKRNYEQKGETKEVWSTNLILFPHTDAVQIDLHTTQCPFSLGVAKHVRRAVQGQQCGNKSEFFYEHSTKYLQYASNKEGWISISFYMSMYEYP